jgi:hypothetical protein
VFILLVFSFFFTSCPALDKPRAVAEVPELSFVTGTGKGEINYSWSVSDSDKNMRCSLFVLKGWCNADEVIANGKSEATSIGIYSSGIFHGDAGEWYSAVVVEESDSGALYSNVKQAKAKRTGTGEYDLRFGVIADAHVGCPWQGSFYPNEKRLEKALDWYNTEDVQALAIVGDITDNGIQTEWDIYKNLWEKHKGGLQLIAVMGNHDAYGVSPYGPGQGQDINTCADRLEMSTGQMTNAHYVIDGYHFIVLNAGDGSFIDQGAVGGAIASGRTDVPGSSWEAIVSQSAKDWARMRINMAKTNAPGKPVFVFLHWPIRNTYFRTDGAGATSNFGNDPLTGFFNDDPEVVVFSGHIHNPNNDPRFIWQGGFTAVNTPPLYYYGTEAGYLRNSIDGIVNGQYPKVPNNIAGQGMLVSVKGSKVIIENYDFDLSEGPTPLGNVVKIPQTWEFDVSYPADFPYTNARREAQKTAPVFDETKQFNAGISEIVIKKTTDTAVEVEFPQAKIPSPNYGNEIVYSYHFDFINLQTGDIDRSAKQFSDFMLTPRLQKPTYTQLIGGLKPNTDYELRIYAYGSFQERSNQYLTHTFTTFEHTEDNITESFK